MQTFTDHSEKITRLQQDIGITIQQFTRITPLTEEEVMAVLGFCAGAVIASAAQRESSIRDYRELCIKNMDHGITAFTSQPKSGLILPN